MNPGDSAYLRLLQSYATSETAKEFYTVNITSSLHHDHYIMIITSSVNPMWCGQMARSLQSRGLVLPSSIHKQSLELAADMGDPVRAGQAVSAIKRSGEKLSATAFSRYILANTRSSVSHDLSLSHLIERVCVCVCSSENRHCSGVV